MRPPPWRETEGGVELAVRVTPRAGATRVEGVVEHGGRPVLKLRLAAPPVEGGRSWLGLGHRGSTDRGVARSSAIMS